MTQTTGKTKAIQPVKSVQGSLRLPGDKSISHRYAMLAAFAKGTSAFTNFSDGADCASTLSCLEALGDVKITGTAGKFMQPGSSLDCGNSGSTMRMLAGLLAGQNISCELIGDESLNRRPMGRVVSPLLLMGADLKTGIDGRPPLEIRPPKQGKLNAMWFKSPIASAQLKSAILFAGLQANGKTEYFEPEMTRDHSELALRAFGVKLQQFQLGVSIEGGQKLTAIEAAIPGDMSSAAFFLCAIAILPGSSLIFDHINLNLTRMALLELFMNMGMKVQFLNMEMSNEEIIGTIKVETGPFIGANISGAQSALLIDELPVLAAIAPWSEKGITIRDAKELRVKETDRIAAVCDNLRRMGATVEEHEDGLTIPGKQKLKGAELDSFGDHRIAMGFAITALRAEGETRIHGAEHVGISFPRFWEFLDQVSVR